MHGPCKKVRDQDLEGEAEKLDLVHLGFGHNQAILDPLEDDDDGDDNGSM